MIVYKRDVRGTVDATSYEGRCQDPDDDCTTRCVSSSDMTTCYECNIAATCKGQLGSHWLTVMSPVSTSGITMTIL